MSTNRSLKGLAFARFTKAVVIGKDPISAVAYGSSQRWNDTPNVVAALKAVVPVMNLTDASVLAHTRPMFEEFLELVRPRSIIDRVVGLREVPPFIHMLRVASGAAAGWVGEGAPAPVGKFSLDREALSADRIVSLIVVTRELLQTSSPLGELAFTRELARGVAAFQDKAFIDPSFGPVPSTSPGSITHGITPVHSSGASLAAVQADIKSLFATFVGADGALEEAVIVMAPRTALALSLLTGSGGAPAFPKLGARGGELAGVPVLVSSACEAGGSPGDTFMVLFDPAQIMIADEGVSEMSHSEHGSVQMNDFPSPGEQQLVSLWQNELVGIRAVRWVTWRRTSTSAVAVLDNITY